MPTRKQIVDSILILASKFSRSDEDRLDEDYLAFLVEQVRVDEILKEYNITHVIDQNWLMDLGMIKFDRVNFSDDPLIDFCNCDISKAELPQIVNLTSLGDGNLDLGLRLLSACGKNSFTYDSIDKWKLLPKEHVKSKFNYYQRFGNSIYVNKLVDYLRGYGIPSTTEGLYIKKTLPVISGSIKNGVVYMVKGANGIITYNGIVYLPGQIFTGLTIDSAFTASGQAQVHYNDYKVLMTENDPYPVSDSLARKIIISILTTELKIEAQEITDVVNDSTDDVLKQ